MSTRSSRRPAHRKEVEPLKLATVTPHPTQKDGGKLPPSSRPKSLVKAVDAGSQRDVLVALRSKLAGALDGAVPAHAFAELMGQFRAVDAEIRVLDAGPAALAPPLSSG